MQLDTKYKIWGSRLFGAFIFTASLVLTPRFFLDSSAAPAVDSVPIQSIQPFDRSSAASSLPIKKRTCISDLTPEHSVLRNNSDQPENSIFTECDTEDNLLTFNGQNTNLR